MNQNNENYKKEHISPIFKSDVITDKEHNIKYRKGKKLGVGGFAEVYEFIRTDTNEKHAAKVINNSRLDDPQSQAAYYYEKKFNKSLTFKYICRCHNIFSDEYNTYFILDYMPNKTLNELNEKRKLSELEIKHYCFELLLAIEFLHKKNIIHRDIKLSNVLLNENMEARLCDFGLAIDNGIKEQKNICGTLSYIAPELYNKKGGLKYSFKTDIWAFGVLMYSLFYHKTPFKKKPIEKSDYNIQNIEVNFHKDVPISKEAKDLLRRILVKDPDNRPKIEEIKASYFFRNGKNIPRYLPDYTIYRPMNKEEEENFLNNTNLNGGFLDKDCDLPHKMANRRSYTEINEMESNYENEDSSSKEYEEEDENVFSENIDKKNKNNLMNKNKQKENENDPETKNKKRISISFSNLVLEKTASREETTKNIRALNDRITDIHDSNKKITDKYSGHFASDFKPTEEEKEDSEKMEMKLSPEFKQKENVQVIEILDIDDEENNNNKINDKNQKKEIDLNAIKINKKNSNKVNYENNKNNYNEQENIINKLNNKLNNMNNNITINKFIDLSDKCGIGYILTNDDIGVYFNDGTKMIRIKHTYNFVYISEKGEQTFFDIRKQKLNSDQKTKVNALLLFYKEFTKKSNKKMNSDKMIKENAFLFVKKWIKAHYAYFFLLSNDKVQIMFEDRSQLIFDFYQKKICFVNKMKENLICNIENTKFSNENMEQKVKYAKRILKKIS